MRTVVGVLLAALVLAGCVNPFQALKERENLTAGPGGLALDYVKPAHAKILVEIDAVAGSEPGRDALRDFETELERALGKPVEVVVESEVKGRGATHAYTLEEILGLERAHRDRYTGGDTAVLYALWLDGRFVKDTVLGVAYLGSSVAMFKATIRDNTKSDDQILPTPGTIALPRERYVERAVAIHEAGHILGLVNNGIPMVKPHEMKRDPVPDTPENEGEAHSTSDASVMFWAVETVQVTNVFTDGEDIPWRFDADDVADLRHARTLVG